MWAVRQSPYGCPENLEAAVKKFRELAAARLDIALGDGFRCGYLTRPEFGEWFDSALEQIPEAMAWNMPKSGHTENVYASRYWSVQPEHDFIDLLALRQNIWYGILKENDSL
jgi:hypothetical protein